MGSGDHPRRRQRLNFAAGVVSAAPLGSQSNVEFRHVDRGRAWTGTLPALLRARGSQLTAKLLEELPGILRWAIDGWRRVRKQVYITQPRGGDNAVEQMIDMATPIPAFLRDRCVVRADAAVPKEDLFAAFKAKKDPDVAASKAAQYADAMVRQEQDRPWLKD